MSTKADRPGTKDWCGKNGRMGFRGVEYNLPTMGMEELKQLNVQVQNDKKIMREMLSRKDLIDVDVEELKQNGIVRWRREMVALIEIRKKQVRAISLDFLRRRQIDRPLEDFLLRAIYETVGNGALVQIKKRATELQEESKYQSKIAPKKDSPPLRQEKMCGAKIRHLDRKSANEQIEDMKASGKNTRGVNVYGPCPFCGYYHVGHKPKGVIWKKGELNGGE